MNKHRNDLYIFTVEALLGGETQAKLSDHLADCIAASRDNNKQSKLAFELTIIPDDEGKYIVMSKINSRPAQPKAEPTILYGTPDNNFVEKDPGQSIPASNVTTATFNTTAPPYRNPDPGADADSNVIGRLPNEDPAQPEYAGSEG